MMKEREEEERGERLQQEKREGVASVTR